MRAAVLILAACGGSIAPPVPQLPPAIEAACGDAVNEQTFERCVGALADLTDRIWRPSYDDPALLAYVQQVADRVANAAGSERVMVRILDEPDLVGESRIGGFIYIGRQTLAVLDNEAELAALLGHEIAHFVAGHARDGLKSPSRSARIQTEEERLADELAVLFVGLAGYRPKAVATMLGRVLSDDAGRIPSVDHPHPTRATRIARVTLLAERSAGTGELAAARYLAAIDGLVVGRDPRAGIVSGNRFIHARSRLAVAWPAGWSVGRTKRGALARRGDRQVEVAVIATELAKLAVDDVEAMIAGDRGLSMVMAGDSSGVMAAKTFRPRPIAIDPIRPARLQIVRARRAGSARALIRRHCQSVIPTFEIERAIEVRRSAGAPIKCVTAGGRAW